MKNQYRSTLVVATFLLAAACFSLALLSALASKAQAQLSSYQQLLREIHKQLVEINTTDSVGSTTQAAEAMAARLKAAGFPARVPQRKWKCSNFHLGQREVPARPEGWGVERNTIVDT